MQTNDVTTLDKSFTLYDWLAGRLMMSYILQRDCPCMLVLLDARGQIHQVAKVWELWLVTVIHQLGGKLQAASYLISIAMLGKCQT